MLITKRITKASIVCFAAATASYLAEATFYGDVDQNGIVQESFFLPLTFILATVGLLLLVVAGVLHLSKK